MTRLRRSLLVAALGLTALGIGSWILGDLAREQAGSVPALPAVQVASAEPMATAGNPAPRRQRTDPVQAAEDAPGQFAVSDRGVPQPLEGRDAVERYLPLLRAGLVRLDRVSDYRATFHRCERVDGLVGEPQVCELAVRHEPFSVAMTWLNGDRGRQAVYVEGRHDDQLLVRLGGWKRRLPPLKLDPGGATALANSRHPVTETGLRALTRRLAADREKELSGERRCECRLHADRIWNGRPCYEFVVEHPSPIPGHPYRKSVQYVDREWLLPVHVLNYAWPRDGERFEADELDKGTFVESYAYADLEFDVGLADDDFDVSRRDR